MSNSQVACNGSNFFSAKPLDKKARVYKNIMCIRNEWVPSKNLPLA